MKKYKQSIYTFMLFISAFIFHQDLFGSHFQGADITYECVGPCTYKVYLSAYRDCDGITSNFDPSSLLNFVPSSGTCPLPTQVSPWTNTVNGAEVTPVCPGVPTSCNTTGAAVSGVEEYSWEATYNFCAASPGCTYRIQWGSNARNADITSGAANQSWGNNVTVINPFLSPCNSSPQFSTYPVPYICNNEVTTFAQGATDINGDSLVYRLGNCLTSGFGSVTYNAGSGYSANTPMGNGWNVNLDPSNGNLTFTPSPGGIVSGVVCVYVDEYRNGVLIGTILRDMQVSVIDCGPPDLNPVSAINQASGTGGVIVDSLTANVCLGNTISFEIIGVDPDSSSGNFQMAWDKNLAINGATFTEVGGLGQVDTINSSTHQATALFQWTPTVSDVGANTFVVTVQDSACPLPGRQELTYTINVVDGINVNIDTTIVGCNQVQFTALPDTNISKGPFMFTWTGDDGLSKTDSTFIYTYSNPGTYMFNLQVSDGTGCSGMISSTVTVTGAQVDPGPEITACSNLTFQIGTDSINGYTYKWTPSTYIVGDSTVAKPFINVTNTSGTNDTIWMHVEVFDGLCTNQDSVMLVIQPEPQPVINGMLQSCYNDTVMLWGTGASSYIWQIDGNLISGDTVFVGPITANKVVQLYGFSPPCVGSSSAIDTIILSIPDTVTISGDTAVCEGFNATLNATGTGTYYVWSTGDTATSITKLFTSDTTITCTPYSSIDCAGIPDTFFVDWTATPIAQYSVNQDTQCFGGHSFDFIYNGPTDTTGLQYQWTFGADATPQTADSANPTGVTFSAPGSYPVTLQLTQNGCVSTVYTDTVALNQNPIASYSVIPSQVGCADTNSFNFTSTGSSWAGITYNWNFGAAATPPNSNVQNPTNIQFAGSGFHVISLQTVSVEGCSSNVYLDSILINGNPTVNISGVDSICLGDSTTLLATGGNTYLWNTGDTTNAITVSPTVDSDYWVIPFSNGCQGLPDTITVHVRPIPTADFNVSSVSSCSSPDSIQVTYVGTSGPNAIYNWDFDGGTVLSGTGSGPYQISWSDSGTKNITLTVNDSGCTSSTFVQQVNITISPQVAINGISQICSNDSIQLTANATLGSGSYVYQWMPNYNILNPNSCCPTVFPDTTTTYSVVVFSGGCQSDTISFTVSVNPAPIVDAGVNLEFCEGSGGVQLQAQILAGDTSTMSYNWMPTTGLSNANNLQPIANPTADTWYYLQATDSLGCSSNIDSMLVQVHSLPITNAGSDKEVCSTDSGTILSGFVTNPNGGTYSYQWVPSFGLGCDTCPTTYALGGFNSDTVITYTLLATSNATGCSSDSTNLTSMSRVTVTVHKRPNATVNITPVYTCLGDSAQLNGFGSGTSGNYSYSWTPALYMNDSTISNPKASPPHTFTYFFTVTDNVTGCVSKADSVTVIVVPNLTVDAGQNKQICEKDSIQLQAISSSTAATYSWMPTTSLSNPNISNPMAAPLVTTTYTVTASLSGCSTTDTVTIFVNPLPDVDAGDSMTVCLGDSVTLNGSLDSHGLTSTFQWTPSTNMTNSNTLTPTVFPTVSTWYKLVSEVAGGCSDSDSVFVRVLPAVNIHIEPNMDTVEICTGVGVQLDVIGALSTNATYSWMPSAGLSDPNIKNPLADPDTNTLYIVTVTENACTGSDSIYVIANKTPIVDFEYGSTSGCNGLEVNFINLSSYGNAYIWDFGDGTISNEFNPTHHYTTAGQYNVTLTVVGNGACGQASSKDSLIYVNPGINAYFLTNYLNELILPNASIAFTDSSKSDVNQWLWDFGDGKISTEQNPEHEYHQAGNYTVKLLVTNELGCSDEYTYPIMIKVIAPEVIIPNLFTPNSDGINDEFKVMYNGNESFSITVFDRQGAQVYVSSSTSDYWDGTLSSGSKAPEGVYFYVIKVGDKTYNGSITLLR